MGNYYFSVVNSRISYDRFFLHPEPENETEKHLLDLVTNYKPDASMGFHPSFANLFTGLSFCFTLICLFGALLNWYFIKKRLPAELWKGFLLIETIIVGAVFMTMLCFTFFPPVLGTGLVFIFVSIACLTVNQKTINYAIKSINSRTLSFRIT